MSLNLKYSVSIENDTNKVISSSDDKFIGINIGTLIKIEGDSLLHTIQDRQSFFYIKDFDMNGSKNLIISEDVGIYLQKSDSLKITYKEYEAKFIINIKNGGQGYMVGQDIYPKGGILNIDIKTGIPLRTCLNIQEVDSNGSIKSLSLKESGKYLSPPDNISELDCVRGEKAEIEIKYLELSNRTFVERSIENIYFSDGKTIIVLNYALPSNLKQGKLSVEKNTLILSENYTGPTKRNLIYQICKDFTPNIKLPLLLKNSLSPDIAYNKACLIIDKEITEIKKRLKLI